MSAASNPVVSLRLPSDLLEQIDQLAGPRKRSEWIESACRLKLGESAERPKPPERFELEEMEPEATFRCPAFGCDKKFGSKAATCPVHGRRVVPV